MQHVSLWQWLHLFNIIRSSCIRFPADNKTSFEWQALFGHFQTLWQGLTLVTQSALELSVLLPQTPEEQGLQNPTIKLLWVFFFFFFNLEREECFRSVQVWASESSERGSGLHRRATFLHRCLELQAQSCLAFLGGYPPSREAKYVAFLVYLPCSHCNNVSFGNRSCCKKMETMTGFPVPNSVKTLIQLCFSYLSKE